MRRTILFWITIALCAGVVAKAQDVPDSYLCRGELPVQATEGLPVSIENLIFSSTIDGSHGGLTAVNHTNKTIQYYLVVLEFIDDAGNYLFSAPIYNVDKDQGIPFDVSFKSWLLANWVGNYLGPIGPRNAAEKVFDTELVALTCPTAARVSVAQIRYDDGTEFKYTSRSLNISPVRIDRFRTGINRKSAEQWLPLTVSGTISVDSEGRARLGESDFAAAGFEKWFQHELSRWQFSAPWADGRPASVQVPFLLILADTTVPRVQLEVLRRRGIRGPLLLLYFGNNPQPAKHGPRDRRPTDISRVP